MTTGGLIMALIRITGLAILAKVAIPLVTIVLMSLLFGKESFETGAQIFPAYLELTKVGAAYLLLKIALGLYLLFRGKLIYRMLMLGNPDSQAEIDSQQLMDEFLDTKPESQSQIELYQKFLGTHSDIKRLSPKERHEKFRAWQFAQNPQNG